MLILGRRINQSIVFPNCGITVRVLDINGRVAKIGIEAPQSVEIKRGELQLALQSSGTNGKSSERLSNDYKSICEQNDAPELPVIQFAQRLAEIKAGLHLFQQRRAAGDEAGADQVFGDLLNEIATLDADALGSIPSASSLPKNNRSAFVSENTPAYQITRDEFTIDSQPVQVLIVNDRLDRSGFDLPAATFHGCQICAVNNHQSATDAISSGQPIDYVVCNGASPFDELELVRTIRGDRRLDATKIFMTSTSNDAKEKLELSNSYRIDGWLARPLQPHDLWKHIVESQ